MPPKEELSAVQIAAIEKWIRDGAYFPPEPINPLAITTDRRAGYDWWSLRPLEQPDLPHAPPPWDDNPIDRFIHSKLAKAGSTVGRGSARIIHYCLTGIEALSPLLTRLLRCSNSTHDTLNAKLLRKTVDEISHPS